VHFTSSVSPPFKGEIFFEEVKKTYAEGLKKNKTFREEKLERIRNRKEYQNDSLLNGGTNVR